MADRRTTEGRTDEINRRITDENYPIENERGRVDPMIDPADQHLRTGEVAGGGTGTTATDDLHGTRRFDRPDTTNRAPDRGTRTNWPTILIVLILVALLLWWIF